LPGFGLIFENRQVIVLLSLLSIAAWVYLIGFHGRFWSSSPELGAGAPSGAAKVVAIVPARDEAAHIRRSIGSLLAQDYPGEFSIVLVDDNSTDGTAAIAASLDAGSRLGIVAGQPLPPGWSGKLWAVQQGLAQPKAQAADFLLLTDADIEHASGHLSSLVAKAESAHFDLVSEMVHLHCDTPVERALIPAFVFFFQMLYPFAWVADPDRGLAAAAGGTILVARAAIERIEGVSRIRGELIDDCALARAIKSTRGHIWLGHSVRARSIRVYRRLGEIWNMIARTAYVQLGCSPLMLLGCLAGMGLLYCAPPLLAICAHGLARLLGLLAWAAMALAFQPTLRRYRLLPFWGAALPLIASFYLGATLVSALRHHAGRGGGWKNRVYPAP
jgi:hopene-associated glycosyltransferase HpnB